MSESFYSNIMVPVDGSREGINAPLEHALKLAETYDSTLMLLYVCKGGSSEDQESMSKVCKNDTKVARSKAETLDVETIVKITGGDPVEKIIQYSQKYNTDMIVMGTHGREGVSRVLRGSVTEKVLRKTEKPVLAVDRDE